MAELGAALLRSVPDQARISDLIAERPPMSLELLQEVSSRFDADVYLLLDQFEELALYQTGPPGQAFDIELGRIAAAPGLRVSMLLGVRDDALATLDRLEPHVRGLFDNYLRLEHLSRAGAQEAIEQPLMRYNSLMPLDRWVSIEPELVVQLLQQLQAGVVSVGDAGRGAVSRSERIETPYLQLVMSRLWSAETEQGSRVLRSQTLRRLGGAEQIVRTHLDAVMADLSEVQRETSAAVFRHLVTPSGMKISHTADDLAAYAETDPVRVRSVLEGLSSGRERVLRPVPPPVGSHEPPRYEIFHDVMASAVLDWGRRYVAGKAEAKHRATRRRLRVSRFLSAALALLLIVTGYSLWDANQSKRAEAQQALLAEYTDKLSSDPADGLRAALEAYHLAATPAAESAVRIALDADVERLRMRADTGLLWTSRFSPDGRTILTAGTDGVAKLFDADTGELLRRFQPSVSGPPPRLSQAEFSPDGTLVVTVTADGAVRLFDSTTAADRGLLTQAGPAVLISWGELAKSQVLLVSDGTGPARLWDPRRNKVIASYGTQAWGAALSADGKNVVAADTADAENRVRVWDARSGSLRETSKKLGWTYGAPRFVGTDSRHVALFLPNDNATRWHAEVWEWQRGGNAFQRIGAESRRAAFLSVSKDGRYVAVPLDKRVQVFDADTMKRIGQTSESPDHVTTTVSISDSGRWLATTGDDGRARLWLADRDNNRPILELMGHGSGIGDVQFNPRYGGELVTAGYDGTARAWQLPTRLAYHGTGDWMVSAAQSRDGRHLVTAEDRGLVTIFDSVVDAGERGWELSGTGNYETTFDWDGMLSGASFTPDGDTVVLAGAESTAPAVWDWRTSKDARPLESGESRIRRFATSDDGRRVAAGDSDGRVVVWDLETEKIVARMPGGGAGAYAMDLKPVPRSGWFAEGSTDGKIRMWDPDHPDAPQRILDTGTSPVRAFEITSDGAYLANVSENHAIQIWRLSDGALVQRFGGPTTTNTDLALSRDGSLLAVSAADGAVHVWRWTEVDARKLAVLQRHGGLVNTVEFTADDSLVTASDDSTVADFPCPTCGDFAGLLSEAEERVAARR